MSMCRVFSCVVGRGCLLWPVCSLGKTLLVFALIHSVLQGQICLFLQVSCISTFAFQSPIMKRMTECGPLGKGMAIHFNILALRTSWIVWKGKKDRTLKDELPRSVGAQYATEDQWRNNSRKNEGMIQSKNNTQLWMWLVMEIKTDARENNTAQEPGMLGPWIKANWKRSNRRWQERTPTF